MSWCGFSRKLTTLLIKILRPLNPIIFARLDNTSAPISKSITSSISTIFLMPKSLTASTSFYAKRDSLTLFHSTSLKKPPSSVLQVHSMRLNSTLIVYAWKVSKIYLSPKKHKLTSWLLTSSKNKSFLSKKKFKPLTWKDKNT